MEKYKTIIGIDPGVTGGISILQGKNKPQVFGIPVKLIERNKRKKRVYDLPEIYKILSKYNSPPVLLCQEDVWSMPFEGSVSSFSFGKSVGITQGMAIGLGFELIMVRPIVWKSHFPQLHTNVITEFKAQAKEKRALGKTIKDKSSKKQNKKEIKKINGQVKEEAKKAARELVSTLYPSLADQFERVDSDGMAESLLIAVWAKDNL